uniref:Uncharacterized protein n=1 Tax=Oryza glumipatula TaxID=40148 RepID=A0A0D9Y883_9ORYZ
MGRKNSMTSSAPTPSPNVDEVQQEMAVGRSASARIRDRASRSLLGQEPYMTMNFLYNISVREGYGDGDSGRPAHWRTAPHRRRSSSLLPSSSYSLGQPKRMIIGSGFSIRRQMLANIQRFICSSYTSSLNLWYLLSSRSKCEDSSVGAGSKEYVHTLIQCGTTEEKD